MTYFLSFIEEAILNPAYKGYRGGRVEVIKRDSIDGPYADEEIRFFTKSQDFDDFRDKWDCLDVTAKQLKLVRKTIAERFYEEPKP